MSKNVTARLQFSLGELLGTVVLTFFGMALLVPLLSPPVPPVIGAIVAIVATWAAAMTVAANCQTESWRWICWIICVPASWCGVYGIVLIASLRAELILIGGFLLIPPTAGFVIGLVRAHARELQGRVRIVSLTAHVLLACLICHGSAAMILQSLLRPRCGGCNTTAAAAACKAYAEAQEIYHRTDYNNDGVLEYARLFDGPESLLHNGEVEIALIDRAFAAAEGPSVFATPKAGYLFRILRAQGKHAPGGAKSYMENGRMTQGYALIAYPAEYDITGRDCFMISNKGTIYQADLGPNTSQIVWAMREFNPAAPTWTPTE